METSKILIAIVIIISFSNPGTAFTATGYVFFQDIDNSTDILPGALVYYNATLNSTTDGNGHYSIPGIPSGTVTLTARKSTAFNTSTGTVSDGSPSINLTLLYSGAFVSNPAISGGRIYTTYTPNFGSINLWEKPNYVWAEIKYDRNNGTVDDKWYFIQAKSEGSGRFSISQESGKGNYKVFFTSSDIYNNPTNPWHPTLNVNRSFDTEIIYFQDTTVMKAIPTRETGIKIDFWQLIPTFIIVIICMAMLAKIVEAKSRRR